MHHISTSAVDLKGLKRYMSAGLLLAALTVLIAAITGCSATHVGKLSPHVAQLDRGTADATVVFIGDSVTHNWADTQFSTWFELFPNWNNQGVIGDSSLFILGRFWQDALQLQPSMVNIIAGTNDVYPNWVPCDMNNMSVYSTCANIAQMVNEARAAHIEPILGTIPPWGCVDTDNHCALATRADNTPGRYDRINQLNAWIKAYGAANNLIVVDYHAALVAADGQHYRPDLTVDGVHPNANGYDLMTPMVEDAIRADSLK